MRFQGNDMFISEPEVEQITGLRETSCYKLIRKLNAELEAKGYFTLPGRVSRRYFLERLYGGLEANGVLPDQEVGG